MCKQGQTFRLLAHNGNPFLQSLILIVSTKSLLEANGFKRLTLEIFTVFDYFSV